MIPCRSLAGFGAGSDLAVGASRRGRMEFDCAPYPVSANPFRQATEGDPQGCPWR